MEPVHLVASSVEGRGGGGGTETGRRGLSAGNKWPSTLPHVIKSAGRQFKSADIGAFSLQHSDFLEVLMLISVRPVKLGFQGGYVSSHMFICCLNIRIV